MRAQIQSFSNGSWKTGNSINTEPKLVVTDENDKPLGEAELAEWLENQPVTIYQGARATAKNDIVAWLHGLKSRRLTYVRVLMEDEVAE